MHLGWSATTKGLRHSIKAFKAVTLLFDVEVWNAQGGVKFFDRNDKDWKSVKGDVSKDEKLKCYKPRARQWCAIGSGMRCLKMIAENFLIGFPRCLGVRRTPHRALGCSDNN